MITLNTPTINIFGFDSPTLVNWPQQDVPIYPSNQFQFQGFLLVYPSQNLTRTLIPNFTHFPEYVLKTQPPTRREHGYVPETQPPNRVGTLRRTMPTEKKRQTTNSSVATKEEAELPKFQGIRGREDHYEISLIVSSRVLDISPLRWCYNTL